jgi:hypothetical protein
MSQFDNMINEINKNKSINHSLTRIGEGILNNTNNNNF